MRENSKMKELKFDVNYGRLASTAEKFSLLLEGGGKSLGRWGRG